MSITASFESQNPLSHLITPDKIEVAQKNIQRRSVSISPTILISENDSDNDSENHLDNQHEELEHYQPTSIDEYPDFYLYLNSDISKEQIIKEFMEKQLHDEKADKERRKLDRVKFFERQKRHSLSISNIN